MLTSEPNIVELEVPCPQCGSRRALEIEVNDDNPEAAEHFYFVCANCDEVR